MRILSHFLYIFQAKIKYVCVLYYKENAIFTLFDFPFVFAGCCQSHQRRLHKAHQIAFSNSCLGLSLSLRMSASRHTKNTITITLTTLGCHVVALMTVKSADKHLANDFQTMEQMLLQTKAYTDGTCTYDNAIKAVRKYSKCIIHVSGASKYATNLYFKRR